MGFRRAAKTALINLGVLLASILVCLVALEVGLRLFWSGYYVKEPKGYVQWSPMRGWENRPSVRTDYGEPEFRTTVIHNSWGFRGPEVTRANPEGRCRALVLGDSFTYGVGVENDETFSARMEQMEPRLQALNTGVNGYGTSQELMLLVEKGLDFSPDLVIVAFFWNDVANTYLRSFPVFSLENGTLRYPTAEVEPAPRGTWPRERHRRFLRHSYAYRFLSDRIKLLRYRTKILLGIPVEDSELLRPEEIEPAWELELALLREIARLARERGATTLVALIPEQVQVQPDVNVIGLRPEDYTVQDRLIDFGRRSRIPVLDLLPALREAYERDRVPLYYLRDRHLRANGHRIVAQRILEEIRRLELVPCLRAEVAQSEPGTG